MPDPTIERARTEHVPPTIPPARVDAVVARIVALHGDAVRDAATGGVRRVAEAWRAEDGDEHAFEALCVDRFLPSAEERRALLLRLERFLERLRGHLGELSREMRRWSDLRGDRLPAFDDLAARFDPAPDLGATMNRQGIAHVARLHFATSTLEEMLRDGPTWDDERWARARVAGAFGPRIPAAARERVRAAHQRANAFVDGFHVPVGTLVDAAGERLYEGDRRLVAHWLIREQIRAGYDRPGGLARQRALTWVMGRTVDGSLPRSVMDARSGEDWEPRANTVGGKSAGPPIGPRRYARWLEVFEAERSLDALHPQHPTALARAFELRREIPLDAVESLLETVLESPGRPALADWARGRLERPLEAHDIYFDRVGPARDEPDLERLVHDRFPDAASLERALPDLLHTLGFPKDAATFYGSRVRVEVARGAGHASGPALAESDAWLRTNTRTDTGELGWDGFDIAIHELGHNIEQLISTHEAPRPALRGVPNAACSEAFAFLFQERARALVGARPQDAGRAADGTVAAEALAAWQIAGPAWLELRAWRWLYRAPEGERTPEALRAEVLRLADEAWSRWYAPFFGPDPHHLLAAYQHMVAYPLYLSSYVIGHVIAHQVRRYVAERDLATEMRRMCGIGRRTPEAWLREAVGEALNPAALMQHGADAAGRLSRQAGTRAGPC